MTITDATHAIFPDSYYRGLDIPQARPVVIVTKKKRR